MKKGDVIWGMTLVAVIGFLVAPATHEAFLNASRLHPYWMAFVKFGVLASMGELLGIRIVSGDWSKPTGLVLKGLVWGFIGMLIAMMFVLYDSGVAVLMTKGYLPALGGAGMAYSLARAFFTSGLMNLLFAPTFMAFHRITDTYIDLAQGKLSGIGALQLPQVLAHIDWNGFITFVVCKTVPLFWIPAHTITFLMPPEYRVLVAAMLSIVLGGILGFAKRKPSAPSKRIQRS